MANTTRAWRALTGRAVRAEATTKHQEETITILRSTRESLYDALSAVVARAQGGGRRGDCAICGVSAPSPCEASCPMPSAVKELDCWRGGVEMERQRLNLPLFK